MYADVILCFGCVKELNDVGKELSARAGELEANREKNRYPYILPCKYITYLSKKKTL